MGYYSSFNWDVSWWSLAFSQKGAATGLSLLVGNPHIMTIIYTYRIVWIPLFFGRQAPSTFTPDAKFKSLLNFGFSEWCLISYFFTRFPWKAALPPKNFPGIVGKKNRATWLELPFFLAQTQTCPCCNDLLNPRWHSLGYTLGRTHINSCDFSISSYSFDDHDGDATRCFSAFTARWVRWICKLVIAVNVSS